MYSVEGGPWEVHREELSLLFMGQHCNWMAYVGYTVISTSENFAL